MYALSNNTQSNHKSEVCTSVGAALTVLQKKYFPNDKGFETAYKNNKEIVKAFNDVFLASPLKNDASKFLIVMNYIREVIAHLPHEFDIVALAKKGESSQNTFIPIAAVFLLVLRATLDDKAYKTYNPNKKKSIVDARNKRIAHLFNTLYTLPKDTCHAGIRTDLVLTLKHNAYQGVDIIEDFLIYLQRESLQFLGETLKSSYNTKQQLQILKQWAAYQVDPQLDAETEKKKYHSFFEFISTQKVELKAYLISKLETKKIDIAEEKTKINEFIANLHGLQIPANFVKEALCLQAVYKAKIKKSSLKSRERAVEMVLSIIEKSKKISDLKNRLLLNFVRIEDQYDFFLKIKSDIKNLVIFHDQKVNELDIELLFSNLYEAITKKIIYKDEHILEIANKLTEYYRYCNNAFYKEVEEVFAVHDAVGYVEDSNIHTKYKIFKSIIAKKNLLIFKMDKIKEWLKVSKENEVIVTPYVINRIMLRAMLVHPVEWEHDFVEALRFGLQHLERIYYSNKRYFVNKQNIFNDDLVKQTVLSSYPMHRIELLKLLVFMHENNIATKLFYKKKNLRDFEKAILNRIVDHQTLNNTIPNLHVLSILAKNELDGNIIKQEFKKDLRFDFLSEDAALHLYLLLPMDMQPNIENIKNTLCPSNIHFLLKEKRPNEHANLIWKIWEKNPNFITNTLQFTVALKNLSEDEKDKIFNLTELRVLKLINSVKDLCLILDIFESYQGWEIVSQLLEQKKLVALVHSKAELCKVLAHIPQDRRQKFIGLSEHFIKLACVAEQFDHNLDMSNYDAEVKKVLSTPDPDFTGLDGMRSMSSSIFDLSTKLYDESQSGDFNYQNSLELGSLLTGDNNFDIKKPKPNDIDFNHFFKKLFVGDAMTWRRITRPRDVEITGSNLFEPGGYTKKILPSQSQISSKFSKYFSQMDQRELKPYDSTQVSLAPKKTAKKYTSKSKNFLEQLEIHEKKGTVGEFLLELALQDYGHEILRLIIRLKVEPEHLNIRTKEDDGKSVLWLLAANQNWEAIKKLRTRMLLKPEHFTAKAKVGNDKGKDIFSLLCLYKQKEIIEYFISDGFFLKDDMKISLRAKICHDGDKDTTLFEIIRKKGYAELRNFLTTELGNIYETQQLTYKMN